MDVDYCGPDPADDAPTQVTCRPVFKIRVCQTTSDLFFNSRSGYRAQYYESANNGKRHNRLLLDELIPALITRVPPSQNGDRGPEWVRYSLEQPSAKIWISEDEIDLADSNNPWLALKRWNDEYYKNSFNTKAFYGSHLHQNRYLKIMGAFLDPSGKEWVPKEKQRRAEDIHDYGFS